MPTMGDKLADLFHALAVIEIDTALSEWAAGTLDHPMCWGGSKKPLMCQNHLWEPLNDHILSLYFNRIIFTARRVQIQLQLVKLFVRLSACLAQSLNGADDAPLLTYRGLEDCDIGFTAGHGGKRPKVTQIALWR